MKIWRTLQTQGFAGAPLFLVIHKTFFYSFDYSFAILQEVLDALADVFALLLDALSGNLRLDFVELFFLFVGKGAGLDDLHELVVFLFEFVPVFVGHCVAFFFNLF